MNNEKFIIKLEKHDTKAVSDEKINGSLTVIWRDWDQILEKNPEMVYVSNVHSGEIKGPHIHTKRNSYFTCIHGEVLFVIKDEDGKYIEIISNEKEPILVHVPKNVPSAHINLSNNTSSVLALADVAWRPNDNEIKNIEFSDYDWKKWKKV
jgi:dTDP-4-dehydrorhamnose 3,5-epimerase